MFNKSERSTFKYWFAHWCAYQMTALNHKCWRPKYLLHDIEKPWLKLIWKDYTKVQKWHRTHRRHHLEYLDAHPNKVYKYDWLAMIIDWECSRFTKLDSPENIAQDLYKCTEEYGQWRSVMIKNVMPLLDKYNFR